MFTIGVDSETFYIVLIGREPYKNAEISMMEKSIRRGWESNAVGG